MPWEDYIADNERIISTFHHRKKKLTTVIGVTENRSFFYQKRKTMEVMVSSKWRLGLLNLRTWKPPPILYLITLILFIVGIVAGAIGSSTGIPYLWAILIIPLMLLIAIYLGTGGTLITYIGTNRIIRTRRNVEQLVEFVRLIHSLEPISKKYHKGASTPQLLSGGAGKACMAVLGFLVTIGIILGVVLPQVL